MRHRATPRFWRCYGDLQDEIQRRADESFARLRHDPRHPSLHMKRVGDLWSVRIGLHHRALALEDGPDLTWFWIGPHAEYDRIVGRS